MHYRTVIEFRSHSWIRHEAPHSLEPYWQVDYSILDLVPNQLQKVPFDLVTLNEHTPRWFMERVMQIKEEINKGFVYQVNLSRRIDFRTVLGEKDFVEFLWTSDIARYGAYGVYHNSSRFFSLSPELFYRQTGSHIVTAPIKGTIGKESGREAAKEKLLQSSKDQAELSMIVDLFRNDLGKIAQTGTVQVTESSGLIETDTLFHTYSQIQAEVKNDITQLEVFRALFPSGSVTGAPKHSAIKYIEVLEDEPREIYCGAIGYFGCGNSAQWNVAIRTAIEKDGMLSYRTGGGITSDSVPDEEFEETIIKTKSFLTLLHRFGVSKET